MSRSLALLVLAAPLAASLLGCFGPRYARETYHESRAVEVVLRGRTDVSPGYDHPATISSVRMAHILASLEVRFDDQEEKHARTPVVPVEAVYPLGDLVSGALAEAEPSQEVVVEATFRSRTLKIFTEKEQTALVVYLKDDTLVVHVARVGFPVPKNPNDRLREPRPGEEYQDFRVLGSDAIRPIAKQAVAVDWRDPAFRRADAIRLRPGGRVERRTILLEEPAAVAPEAGPAGAPAPSAEAVDLSELSPEALRRLADLEEERRRGVIDEIEYRARRREILAEGRR